MAAPAYKILKTGSGNRVKPVHGDIIECAINGWVKEIDEILEFDPEQINAQRPRNGITAVIAASGLGNTSMVRHLLSKDGINVRLRDDFGKDALDHARPFPEIVKLLMDHLHPGAIRREPHIFSVTP